MRSMGMASMVGASYKLGFLVTVYAASCPKAGFLNGRVKKIIQVGGALQCMGRV
jgi:hypothetical protein